MTKQTKQVYPYENLELSNMKGEIWRPIKELDEHYMVQIWDGLNLYPVLLCFIKLPTFISNSNPNTKPVLY